MVKQSEVVKWIESQVGKSITRGSGNAQCVALINEFYIKLNGSITDKSVNIVTFIDKINR